MKNNVLQYQEDQALADKLLGLERQIKDYKSGNQAPTIGVTAVSTISGALYGSYASSGGPYPPILLRSHLLGTHGETLMAIPEIDAFIVQSGTRVWPEGQQFGDPPSIYIDLKQWIDYESNRNDNNVTAYIMLRIDASLLNQSSNPPWTASNWQIGVRWRFMLAEA